MQKSFRLRHAHDWEENQHRQNEFHQEQRRPVARSRVSIGEPV